MAAQLTSTKGPPARGPPRWIDCATRPLPEPVSPFNEDGGQLPSGFPAHQQPPDLISHRLDLRALSDQLGQRIHGAPTLPLLFNLLVSFLPV